MKRIAVISAILEEPSQCQSRFNEIVSEYQSIVQGRMGIPFARGEVAAICITVVGTLDEINALTGRLGKIPNVSVKTSVSKKTIGEGEV